MTSASPRRELGRTLSRAVRQPGGPDTSQTRPLQAWTWQSRPSRLRCS